MDRKLLRLVYEKMPGACWYCGSTIDPLGEWEVEHQVPKSQGGGNELANLVPSCRGCNGQKGPRTVDQYRHALQVKLENQITSAREMTWEICAYMPEGLGGKLDALLESAALIVVNNPPVFCGEDVFMEPSSTEATEIPATEAVQ